MFAVLHSRRKIISFFSRQDTLRISTWKRWIFRQKYLFVYYRKIPKNQKLARLFILIQRKRNILTVIRYIYIYICICIFRSTNRLFILSLVRLFIKHLTKKIKTFFRYCNILKFASSASDEIPNIMSFDRGKKSETSQPCAEKKKNPIFTRTTTTTSIVLQPSRAIFRRRI